ncbi:sigma-70 family RNA polymerase sigma factor [Actinoplanes bogorensis]|uniref:Sigma-70 family RNA polymerase sigma factor n=1 Tax=Paractinoplanes bogorensis TaxID=1610840 RepID=A0ABS5Z0E2_9ACTN|nr:sigma-70 family RNA polymerase sigma factor [Actinoplanes bogorensis]MBU2669161.1 sigma-70 family RNA polymerase sigma factor [Actinoplanes bogorensis]
MSADVHLGDLLERARDGDRESLRELVHELNPVLWRVARGQGLSAEDAADVVQTTWLELLRRLHEIRSPRAVTAWLITATRRESWHRQQRGRRDRPDSDGVLEAAVDPGPPPEQRLLTDERDEVLWRHFARLSDRCRELLSIVAEVHRPDYAAIASSLGMPHGSIGPTRGRCLAKLREMLLADSSWGGAS